MESLVFVIEDEAGRLLFTTEDEAVAEKAWENGYVVLQQISEPINRSV